VAANAMVSAGSYCLASDATIVVFKKSGPANPTIVTLKAKYSV
jgi:hypothetical protein